MIFQPPHIVASFDSYFIVAGESVDPGPEEASTITDKDGVFYFPSVHAGDWSVVAEADPIIDAKSGVNTAPSGVVAVTVGSRDTRDIRISLTEPFTLTGSANWQVMCVEGRLFCGRRSAEGIVTPIWFRALDGQPSAIRLGMIRADGTLGVDRVRPGRYLVYPLPPLADGKMVLGGHL
jgi:hypothetical protein